MLKTSYYANFRSFPEGALRVSISLKTPPDAADIHIPELAPDAALLWDYKAGRTNKAGYTLRYTMKLKKLLDSGKLSETLAPLIAESRPVILLCYERPGAFCHRKLLADFVSRNLGIEIPEL